MVYRPKRGLYLVVLLVTLTITLGIGIAATLSEGIFSEILITPDPIKLGNNTNIYITTSQNSSVGVNVYNEAGILVKTLLNNTQKNAGTFSLIWDGKNNEGVLVPDGRYKFSFLAKDNTDNIIGQAERTLVAARVPSISDVSDAIDPFNPNIGEKSTITYSLSSDSLVTITILKGYAPVRTLKANGLETAGTHSIVWDGKDDNGILVGDATYTYQIDAVSPQVDTFKSTFKSTTALDKEAPSISDFNIYTDPFKISVNSLNISYTLSENSNVTIKVVNSSGNVVHTILNNISKNAGYNSISWDGKDSSGVYIPEGQYNIVINAIDNSNKPSVELKKPFTAGYIPSISNVSIINNPFDPTRGEQSTINFSISNEAYTTVTILKGYAPVRTILNNELKEGSQSVIWNGKDDSGTLVADGTYTYQIDAVSKTVPTFKSTSKGSIVLDKEAPKITDLSVNPDPLKIGINNATIGYTLSENSKVTIKIIDSSGKEIQTILDNAEKNLGYNSSSWDGKDKTGILVSEGLYNVVINAVDYNNKVALEQTKTITAAYVPSITNVIKLNDPFNPLNGEQANFNYTLTNNALVTVTIFNGYTPVRTLVNNELKLAGTFSVNWDGKDDAGNLLGDATYTFQIDAVSPTVSYFKSTFKSTVMLEKAAPQISDISVTPNPFKIGEANLSIRYTLSEGSKVTVKIIDSNGNLVKSILNNVDKNTGYNSVTWDGRDDNSNYIPEGAYEVVISAIDNANKSSGESKIPFNAGNSISITNVNDAVDPFNPLNGELSTINFTTTNKAYVTVTVYNGFTPVRTLVNNQLRDGGTYSVIWDGKDDTGNLLGDGTYTYQIDAASPIISTFKATVKGSTTLDKEAPQIKEVTVYPDPLKLGANSLNVNFTLTENAKVTIKVFDNNGNLIKTVLDNVEKNVGFNKIVWDGKNSSGQIVNDGTYKVTINAVDGLSKPAIEQSITFVAASAPVINNVIKLNDPLNPTNNEQAVFNYTISNDALVTVTIYNGYVPIKVLTSNEQKLAGTYSITWDGKDDSGNYLEDGTYSYQIEAVNSLVTTFKNTYKDSITVEAKNPSITDVTLIPNPVLVETSATIQYYLSESAKVTVDILDSQGQLVRQFPETTISKGIKSLTWDTKDNNSNFVPAGNYTIKITAKDNYNKIGIAEKVLQVGSGPIIILTSSNNQTIDFSISNKANISYTINEKANVTISIFNSKNELWRQLYKNKEVLNSDSIGWDGRSSDGRIIAGTYTFVIDSTSTATNFPSKQVIGTITLSNIPNYLTNKCTDCHTGYPIVHPVTNCNGCHGGNLPVQACYNCHSEWAVHSDGRVLSSYDCTTCHNETYSYKIPVHVGNEESIHLTSTPMDDCITCHKNSLITEHLSRISKTTDQLIDCNSCHDSDKEQVITAIQNKDTSCYTCHTTANHEEIHISSLSEKCYSCHNKSLSVEHANKGYTCDSCHKSTDPKVVNAINWGTLACTECHETLHGLSSGKALPGSIPKYSQTSAGNNLRWLEPTSTEFWKDESWFPSGMAGGYLTLTNRNSSLTGEAVYNYYVTEMPKLGWKKVTGPSTASSKFELVFTKDNKKSYVRFYNTATYDNDTTVPAGYRIEIIYK